MRITRTTWKEITYRCLVFFKTMWISNCFRKGALLRNNLLHFVAAGLMFSSRFAHSYEMIIAGRLLVGICAGIFTISFQKQQMELLTMTKVKYHYSCCYYSESLKNILQIFLKMSFETLGININRQCLLFIAL